MSLLVRWVRFNAVGVLGMGVQLAALAGLNRWFAGHYLAATCAALELTLLHNFWWHQRFTWRDRMGSTPRLQALVRFHLSNGLVSLCGNLLLMRVLVHGLHVPVLPANVIAILCCSVANFLLSTRWAFASGRKTTSLKKGISLMCIASCFLFAIVALGSAGAQVARSNLPQLADEPVLHLRSEALPQAPQPAPRSTANDSYFYHLGSFCGLGASQSTAALKPTFGCGAGMTLVPLPIFVEVGVMGPQANRSYVTGYVSVDVNAPLAPLRSKYAPQVLFGYSRLFETGHALDYGVALALPRRANEREGKSLRLELRDYWTFANPSQHNVMLRVGWMVAEYGD